MPNATLRAIAGFIAAPILLAAIAGAAHGAHDAHGPTVTNVGILLFDGVQIIDFAAPYEVFGQAGFGVATVSEDGKPVTTAMGLKVTPDHAFADAPPFDVLLVPGGDVDDAAGSEVVKRFVRERSGAADQVLSVCTGSHILAASGLLDGLQATTFHRAIDGLARDYPKVKVIRGVRWADNGKIVTSAGLSSGIDAALHIVAKLRGVDAARSTALHLEYDWQPNGGFIRSRLADRYLPNPDVQWPGDAKIHRLLSLGDEQQWRQRFHVASKTPPAQMLALIETALDDVDEWERADGDEPHVWQRDADGRQVRLRLLAQPGTDESYVLELELEIVPLAAKTSS